MTTHTDSRLRRAFASIKRVYRDLDHASRLLIELPVDGTRRH